MDSTLINDATERKRVVVIIKTYKEPLKIRIKRLFNKILELLRQF